MSKLKVLFLIGSLKRNIVTVYSKNLFWSLIISPIVIITIFSISPSSILSSYLPIDFIINYINDPVYAQQNNNNNLTKILVNDTWTSKRENLSIILKLEPKVPIIDQWTHMYFEINGSGSVKVPQNVNLTVNATISDHDGRLFKFPEKEVIYGKFNNSYIFPDDGQHRVILQIYKNNMSLTIATFDINIPHPQPPKGFFESLFEIRPY